MKKRGLLLLIAFIICVSLFPGAQTFAFPDVAEDNKHSTAISYLAGKGVINGYEDGTFRPDDTITRAEFIKILLESLGIGNMYGSAIVKTGFSDVDVKNENGVFAPQHWAAGYIKVGVDKQIINGFGNGLFKPDDPVKYEEAIKMVVCGLGRGDMAKTNASKLDIPLWPDGYLKMGEELKIATNADYALGVNATRSNVAQMVYNVKDVPVVQQQGIPVINGSVGGGSYGGGGRTEPETDIENSTDVVENLRASGMVVAAEKVIINEIRKELIIDENIVIGGEPLGDFAGYIVVKLDNQINGEDYARFYVGNQDHSSYLGANVKIIYQFDPHDVVGGRYEVQSVDWHEKAKVTEIEAKSISSTATSEKNAASDTEYLCYYNSENTLVEQSLYTTDLDELTVVYNNKIIDVAEMRAAYRTANPSFEGEDSEIDIITISDLMPKQGNVRLVDANRLDSRIDLIWVNSYETYVVGNRSFHTSPKKITDKFRKIPETDIDLELILDDSDSEKLEIIYGGVRKRVEDIAANDILTVAKSKCGEYTNITVTKYVRKQGVINSIRTGNVEITLKNILGKYTLSNYYIGNNGNSVDHEVGDSITVYCNSNNEILWFEVAAVSYQTGYLTHATYSSDTEKMTLWILGKDGNITKYTMADRPKYITRAVSCLAGVTPNSTGTQHGNMYKNLDEQLIYNSLKENADVINTGKSTVLRNGGVISQPVLYAVSGTTITDLVSVEPNTTNSFTGTKRQYKVSNNVKSFTDEGNTFSADGNDALFIFVPNDRISVKEDKNQYKIGSAALSKLVAYMDYNIEPYYIRRADNGTPENKIFVIYNESLDNYANYRSENIIVKTIEPVENSLTRITGYVGNATKTYTFSSAYSNAWVLDENYTRTGERREIAVGDVIRAGHSPDGSLLRNLELVYDISEDQKNAQAKSVAIKYNSQSTALDQIEDRTIYYYSRVGKISAVDTAQNPSWVDLEINGGATSRLNVGSTYFGGTQIHFYNYRAEVAYEEQRLGKTTMGSLFVGDMVYVWQGENEAYKTIYAVRYPIEVTP